MMKSNLKPKVSIIIPTYLEEKYIGKTLKSIKKQNYKNYEIIVVDSNSKDKTIKIAKKYADKIIILKERGIAKARNCGANESSGEILLFLDADVVLNKNFIKNMVEKFKDKKIVGVCGYIKTHGSLINRFIFALCSEIVWFLLKLKLPSFYGICMGWRRDVFKSVGGFDENLVTAEDIDFTKKAKRKGSCVLMRESKVITSPRRIIGMGLMRTLKFHTINFLRYKFLKRPKRDYVVIR